MEQLKTPEIAKTPDWLTEYWNNPTKTTLSEKVFASRLAEIQKMKDQVSPSMYQRMIQPFQDAFSAEINSSNGIAITSQADLNRIKSLGLIENVNWDTLSATLTTLKDTDGDLGYFRVFIKKNENGSVTLKKNNSWLWNYKGSALNRNIGIWNYGLAVNYEVDLRNFPKKTEFDREATQHAMNTFMQKNSPALATKEWQEVVAKTIAKKQQVKENSKESQIATLLPTLDGQKVVLTSVTDTKKVQNLLQMCDLGEKCVKDNKLDIVSLQKALEGTQVATNYMKKYTGRTDVKWVDGKLWSATLAALEEYTNKKKVTQENIMVA